MKWSSVFVSSNKELGTTYTSTATAIYEEFRDELDGFATVKN